MTQDKRKGRLELLVLWRAVEFNLLPYLSPPGSFVTSAMEGVLLKKKLRQHVLTGLVGSCTSCTATTPHVSMTFGMRRHGFPSRNVWRATCIGTLSCQNLAASWDRMMRYKINDKIHELSNNILGLATHTIK